MFTELFSRGVLIIQEGEGKINAMLMIIISICLYGIMLSDLFFQFFS